MTPDLMMQPIIMQCKESESCSYVSFHPLSDQETEGAKRERNHAEIHFLQVPMTLKSVTLALNL